MQADVEVQYNWHIKQIYRLQSTTHIHPCACPHTLPPPPPPPPPLSLSLTHTHEGRQARTHANTHAYAHVHARRHTHIHSRTHTHTIIRFLYVGLYHANICTCNCWHVNKTNQQNKQITGNQTSTPPPPPKPFKKPNQKQSKEKTNKTETNKNKQENNPKLTTKRSFFSINDFCMHLSYSQQTQ